MFTYIFHTFDGSRAAWEAWRIHLWTSDPTSNNLWQVNWRLYSHQRLTLEEKNIRNWMISISAKCSWTYSDSRIFVSCPALNSNQIEHIWWSSATYMVEHQVIFRNFCMDIKLSNSWTKSAHNLSWQAHQGRENERVAWQKRLGKTMIDQTFFSTIINILYMIIACTVCI